MKLNLVISETFFLRQILCWPITCYLVQSCLELIEINMFLLPNLWHEMHISKPDNVSLYEVILPSGQETALISWNHYSSLSHLKNRFSRIPGVYKSESFPSYFLVPCIVYSFSRELCVKSWKQQQQTNISWITSAFSKPVTFLT